MSKTKTTKEYFDEWHPYDRLIQHNYMRHQEMIQCLRKHWLNSSKKRSSILEVGCGNAYVVAEALSDQSDLDYTGIDLSATALAGAAKNLEQTDWTVNLLEGDALARIRELQGAFDGIVSGFSLHHFSVEENLQLLKEMRRLLAPDGLMIVYDIVTREDESREDFLERLIAGVDLDAVQITRSQMDTMSQHIRDYDFPIRLSSWQDLSVEAGFSDVTCEYRDEEEYYAFLRLSR